MILKIDADLTADLSLSKIAEDLNINASYLSRLFKQEIGVTLTDYVSRKRVDHGLLLLNSTKLQIQTIATLSRLTYLPDLPKTWEYSTNHH